MTIKSTRGILGHSHLRLLVHSHRSLIHLLRTARFARALRCAYSFARSLTHFRVQTYRDRGKEVFVFEMNGIYVFELNASISYNFHPLCSVQWHGMAPNQKMEWERKKEEEGRKRDAVAKEVAETEVTK